MRLTPRQNTGIVPPYILDRLGSKLPGNGNGGVVPPYLQDRLKQGTPANGNTGVVPPHLRNREAAKDTVDAGELGGCYPNVPTQKDPSGIDIVFDDVKLPKAGAPNLTGYTCFPHLAPRTDSTGLQLFAAGVKLPN